MPEANACPCGREAVLGNHGPRLCRGCDADHDAILAIVLAEDFSADDESSACITSGCDARVQPGESCDGDVAVCVDCYGEGRVWQ